MLISIIMPYYNGIHFLSDAFESIRQALLHCDNNDIKYELVLVLDDGTEKAVPDIPGSVIKSAAEYREEAYGLSGEYKELFEQEVPGKITINEIPVHGVYNVAALRNEGIRKATGCYLYFMDSDDYLLPETLNNMEELLHKEEHDIIAGKLVTGMFKYETYLSEINQKKEAATDNTAENKAHNNLVDRLCSYRLSALNILIRREYLSSNIFDENNELYPDMSFTATILSCTDDIYYADNMVYVKRIHNDSVQFPALDQVKITGRSELYKKSLDNAVEIEAKYSDNNRGEIHGKRPGIIEEAVALVKHKEKTFKRKRTLRRIGNFFRRPTFLFRLIEKVIFRRLNMKDNWIVFESFKGKSYSDSCKYIYEYLADTEGDNYKYIWVLNNKKTKIPGNVEKVKYLSLRWFYYTSRAKYYVNNVRQPAWKHKRKGSVHLETWHGTPLKKLVFDMEDVHSATATHKQDVYDQSRGWDYLISDNPFSTDIFESCFLYPREQIIETGYPRNDVLYAPDINDRADIIRKKLGIAEGKKVILYAPTWRDDEYYGPGQYQFALKLNLDKMRERFGNEYVVLLRTHYYIADAIDTNGYDGFAYNVSRYDDIAELYLIADMCITDYSSVFFDYANLKRPILFYVYDFEKYKNKLRGFYIDMETELPGPLLYTEEELYEAIDNIDKICEAYKNRYNSFYDRFCGIDDGNAAKRVADIVWRNSDGK